MTRAALRTPSRVLILAAAAVAIAIAVAVPDAPTRGGWLEMTQLVGGLAVLTVIFGWRWFWRGRAVQRTYDRHR